MYEENNKPLVDVQAVLGDQPPLTFNLTYSYIGDYWNNNSKTNDGNYGWKYVLAYKTSSNIDIDSFPDKQSYAAYEYYSLDVSTENGLIATLAFDSHAYSRTYWNNNISTDYRFTIGSQQWFSYNSTQTMYSAANSQEGPAASGNGTAWGEVLGTASDWNMSAGKPQTIFATVRLLGWVIINGNSTTVHYGNSDPIMQIPLQSYGNGFIYNNLLTQDELSQINPVVLGDRYFTH
jgi:hypothetical protein